ncbi:hypothetical protein LZ32DRAFT_203188 [Colletotrichum eremochloae]|nr:hypothetical protein LZ32DRAFT_203188 [Colletotrichum eremochloae]
MNTFRALQRIKLIQNTLTVRPPGKIQKTLGQLRACALTPVNLPRTNQSICNHGYHDRCQKLQVQPLNGEYVGPFSESFSS